MDVFPIDAWKEIFSKIPPYPMSLPDDLVRQIADLAIHVRNMPEQIEAGIDGENYLQTYMAVSLASGSLRRITAHIQTLLQEKTQEKEKAPDREEERTPDLFPDVRSMRRWDSTT